MRNTYATRTVLLAFATPKEALYGLQIVRRTGLASGTVYPILRRLESGGYLTAEWEQIDPCTAGRPPRRLYRPTSYVPIWWQDEWNEE